MPIEESINNAIALLSRATLAAQGRGDIPVSRASAILALGRHWERFWRSSERTLTPTSVLTPTLSRYVEWYTRAWAMLPPDARAECPRPDQIDPTLAKVARDTIASYMTGLASAPDAARWVASQSSELATAIKSSVVGGLETLAFAGGALLIAYLIWRGDR